MVNLMIRDLVVLAYVTGLTSAVVNTCQRTDCLCTSGRFYDGNKCRVNIAYGKNTTQNTTLNETYVSSKAVNGDIESSYKLNYHDYTRTLERAYQWWRVDLEKTYYVYKVMMWTRIYYPDRPSDIYTLSSNGKKSSVPAPDTWTVLHYQEKAYGNIEVFHLAQPIVARHLAVLRNTTGILTLVEFMAFALESGECYGDIVCDAERNCKNISGSGFEQCQCSYVNKGNFDACNAVDVDECDKKTGDICRTNEDCTNTWGSFNCTCKVGYEGEGTVTSCEDINECSAEQENECHTHAMCINTDGGYTCDCNVSYKGDGTYCEFDQTIVIVLSLVVLVAVICLTIYKVATVKKNDS